MKRIMLVLMALWMLCSCAWAGAPESEWAVVNNPDPEDRLNLRAEPSRASSSLGKYFNGVLVKVLERTGDGWAHVLVTDQPQDFSLSAPGTYGYVRTDALSLHSPWNAF